MTSARIPSTSDLWWPVLEAVRLLGGSATNDQIDDAVASAEGLSDADRKMRYEQSGLLVFSNRIAFACSDLRKAELLANPERRVWAITERGKRVDEEETGKQVRDARRPRTSPNAGSTWVMAADAGSRRWPEFLRHEIAAIGWHLVGDLSRFSDRPSLDKAMQTVGYSKIAASMLWKFGPFGGMKQGDTIVVKRGTGHVIGCGRVEGEYRFDESLIDGYPHMRKMTWRGFENPNDRSVSWKLPRIALVDYTRNPRLQDLLRVVPEIENGFDTPMIDEVPSGAPYSVDAALKDVFLSRDLFEQILRSLRTRKNLILQGPPGTGKTFMARRLAWCLMGRQDKDALEMVQFHQSYAYEDFVQGYRPNADGGFVLRSGVFLEFCGNARKRPETPHVLVVDEINRGNLSRIFGELLMLIEADKRDEKYAVSMTYGELGDRFHIPPNLHILGLMNTADRSLAVVDYALRRRFAFEELRPAFGGSEFKTFLVDKRGADSEFVQVIDDRLQRLNDQIAEEPELGPDFCIGHSYFVPEEGEQASRTWYENVVRTQIAPLLREYWFESDSRESAESAVQELLAR